MSKHTPGPWNVRSLIPTHQPGMGELPLFVVDGGDENDPWVVAYLDVGGESDPLDDIDLEYRERGIADARLISSAPDLLAACEDVLERIDAMPEMIDLIGNAEYDRLRAAIAKARGESGK